MSHMKEARKKLGLNESYTAQTDRTRIKSATSLNKSMTALPRNGQTTREIVIQTQEPQFPLITILRVENHFQDQLRDGSLWLDRVVHQMKVKRLHNGFAQLTKNCHSTKLYLVQVNRLVKLLDNRQSRLTNFGWLAILRTRTEHKAKLNAARFIYKVLQGRINKIKNNFILQIRSSWGAESKERSLTADKAVIKQQKATIQEDKLSSEFLTVCQKLTRYNLKTYAEQLIQELNPSLQQELKKLKQLGLKSTPNVESVLIVMQNSVLTIKSFSSQLRDKVALIEQLQKSDTSVNYQAIQEEFRKADQQIKKSLERNKKIGEKEISTIIERQVKSMMPKEGVFFYESRIFMMALVVKLLSRSTESGLLISLEELFKITNNLEKLTIFKKSHAQNSREQKILSQLASKFIEFQQVQKLPIKEQGYEENEESFKAEIKYIGQEIKNYIQRYRKESTAKRGLLKIFSTKKSDTKGQFSMIYHGVTQLTVIISKLNSELKVKQDTNQDDQKLKIALLISTTYADCLKESNVSKWEKFIKTINVAVYGELLKEFDRINDYISEKIENASSQSVKKLSEQASNQKDLQKELNLLKKKNSELQNRVQEYDKKLQELGGEEDLRKTIAEKNKEIKAWEVKFADLTKKFNKSEMTQKNQQQKVEDAMKKLQEGSNSSAELSDENKKLIKENQNLTNQIKKQQALSESNMKKLENQIEKLKKEISNYEQQGKIVDEKNLQIKELQKIIQQNQQNSDEYSNLQKRYEEVQSANYQLKEKINIVTAKMEDLMKKFEAKQVEIRALRGILEQAKLTVDELDKANDLVATHQRKITMLENTIQSLQIQIQRINIELNKQLQNSSQITEIENSTLKLLEQENYDLRLMLGTKDQRVRELETSLSKIQIEANTYFRELNLLKEELKSRQNSQALKDRTITELNIRISQNSQKITFMTKQLEEEKLKYNQAPLISKQELQKLHQQLSRSESQNSSLRTKISQMEKQGSEMRQSLQRDYEKMIEQLNISIAELKRKQVSYISDKTNEINILQYTINELQLKLLEGSQQAPRLDNIVLLVGNILSSYTQIQSKETQGERAERIRLIFDELTGIKNVFGGNEEDFFVNTENFAMEYIRKDIGYYRGQLIQRIEYISGFKERFEMFLSNEIAMSQQLIETKYKYEYEEVNTIHTNSPVHGLENPEGSPFTTPKKLY